VALGLNDLNRGKKNKTADPKKSSKNQSSTRKAESSTAGELKKVVTTKNSAGPYAPPPSPTSHEPRAAAREMKKPWQNPEPDTHIEMTMPEANDPASKAAASPDLQDAAESVIDELIAEGVMALTKGFLGFGQWIHSIEVQPRLRIPVPPVFTQREVTRPSKNSKK